MFNNQVIGRFSFDESKIDFSNPLFLEGNAYFPLMCLMGSNPVIPYGTMRSVSNGSDKESALLSHIQKYALGVSHIFDSFNGTNSAQCRYFPIPKVLGVLNSQVKRYLNASPNTSVNIEIGRHLRTSYLNIKNSFFDSSLSSYYLQSMRTIISGKGSMFKGDGKSILMSIVFRGDLLKYHKLYYLTHDDFDYANMEFWINCDIDTPQYPYKAFRKMYRSMIKPVIVDDLKMRIVEKGDVDRSLRALFNIPQNSVAELEEWKSNLLSGFLEKEAGSTVFEF